MRGADNVTYTGDDLAARSTATRTQEVEILGKVEPYTDAAFATHASLFEASPEFIEIGIGSLDEAPSSIGMPERENWTNRREPSRESGCG